MSDYYGLGLRAALSVLLALAAAPFASAQSFRMDEANSDVIPNTFDGALAWADYDGDGDLDLVVTGGTEQGGGRFAVGELYRNDAGTLVRDAAASRVIANVGESALAWGDYDGDGDPDLVVTGLGLAPVGELYRNEGGTLVLDVASSAVIADVREGALAWADYDSDGDLDLAVVGVVNGFDSVGEVYRNDGGALVLDAANSAVLPDVYYGALGWADYDSDGDPDLVVTGIAPESSTLVGDLYRNDGGALVRDAASSAVIPGVSEGALAWGDYDADGDPDLAITGIGSGYIGDLYRNDGGALVRDNASSAVIASIVKGALAWADYDSDGDLDLALVGLIQPNGFPYSDVYRNDGGTLVRDAGNSATIPRLWQASLAWADYDSDGDPDLVVAGRSTTISPPLSTVGAIYRNESSLAPPPVLDLTLRPVPVNRPFIHVDPGESFLFNFNLTNRDVFRRGGDGWFVVRDAVGAVVYESASAAYSLRRERDRSWRLLVETPAWAAPGDYTVVGYVGAYPGVVFDADSLAFLVRDRGPAARSATSAWALVDAETGAALADWDDDIAEAGPVAFGLGSPYPNPVAGLVAVPYSVAEPGVVRLAVYDVLGREAVRLVDGPSEAGAREARFETGTLPAGAYVVRLEAGGSVATARLVVAR